MKYLIITLLVAFCINAQAVEPHSPQFKCLSAESTEATYILLGNAFVQIHDLDWSKEIYLATANEYTSGSYQNNELYLIQSSTSTEIVAKMAARDDAILILTGENHLLLKDGYDVTEYSCKRQAYVD